MTLEDKIKNAKPSDLFDNIPKKKQRLIIQKNKRRLKRLKRRIKNENNNWYYRWVLRICFRLKR